MISSSYRQTPDYLDLFLLKNQRVNTKKEYKIIVIMVTINVVNVDIYVLD